MGQEKKILLWWLCALLTSPHIFCVAAAERREYLFSISDLSGIRPLHFSPLSCLYSSTGTNLSPIFQPKRLNLICRGLDFELPKAKSSHTVISPQLLLSWPASWTWYGFRFKAEDLVYCLSQPRGLRSVSDSSCGQNRQFPRLWVVVTSIWQPLWVVSELSWPFCKIKNSPPASHTPTCPLLNPSTYPLNP